MEEENSKGKSGVEGVINVVMLLDRSDNVLDVVVAADGARYHVALMERGACN